MRREEISYTFPCRLLKRGHSFGNSAVYLTLDPHSNVMSEAGTARLGMRSAWSQKYLFFGWQTDLLSAGKKRFIPSETTFTPNGQSTLLRLGKVSAVKKFVLPFENFLLSSAHFLFEGAGKGGFLQSRIELPPGTQVAAVEKGGHRHLIFHYSDGSSGVLWGSENAGEFKTAPEAASGNVALTAVFPWSTGRHNGISFAHSVHGREGALLAVDQAFNPDAGSPESHLRHIQNVEKESSAAIQAHLDTCRLITPDPDINAGLDWAKANQLKDYQQYRWGAGFSNNPPSDVVVGRDTFWFLLASNFYAPAWSRRMLDLWFSHGVEPSGKVVEYMRASSDPLFRDDYGLNINDNTPLLLIAAHHYFSLSADRGFLAGVYPTLLRSANYILAQRNEAGLVWCRSREYFVRGLCGWRNCTSNYQLSGAVTEINAECYRALITTAELAAATGDTANAARLRDAAKQLLAAIRRHLRSRTARNPHFLLNIDPDGLRNEEMTGDLLFPALFSVATREESRAILDELFGENFWQGSASGAGGIRTASAAEKGCHPKADPGDYGLQGGVWPNLALWAARSAGRCGRPDLLVKALRATRLLADRPDFDSHNVTPGEFPEYYNGDDLVQRGSPRSTFIHGSYLWAAWEGLLGMTPHADHLEIEPSLPDEWQWAALRSMAYQGQALSLVALKKEKRLYTTMKVRSSWKQTVASEDEVWERIESLRQ